MGNKEYIPTLDPLFVVLGMLEDVEIFEDKDPGFIENFYSNEALATGQFVYFLSLAARDLGKEIDVELNQFEEGNTTISSLQMASVINELFPSFIWKPSGYLDNRLTPVKSAHRHIEESMFPKSLPPHDFLPKQTDSRLSYLYGIKLRYGFGDFAFRLKRGSAKIPLIVLHIETLKSEWVNLYTVFNCIPGSTEITFLPHPITKRFFEESDDLDRKNRGL